MIFLYEDASNGRIYNGLNCAYQMKSMLDSLGFAYVWNTQALDNLKFHEIKQRLFDNVNQELVMSINTSTKLQSYCLFKEDTQSEL